MNDFDGLLTTEFGFKPQGKSAPMAASKASSYNSSSLNFDLGSRSARASNSFAGGDSVNAASFDDLFGGGGKPEASYDFDSVFRGSADFRSKSVNLPVHDKPVYDKPMYDDDDIFDGVPGLKSSSKFSYGDVFAPAAFDDLLGGLGESKPSEKGERGVADFDDLIPGFGSSKASTDRYATCLLLNLFNVRQRILCSKNWGLFIDLWNNLFVCWKGVKNWDCDGNIIDKRKKFLSTI